MQARKLMAALMIVVFAAAGVFAAEATTRPARQLTPRRLLIKRVQGVSLGNMPLMRVLKHYSDLSGLTVKAEWGALERIGITKQTRVTLKTRPMRFSKLLDFTLSSIAPRNHPLAWYLSGKEVTVSTQMRVLLRNRVSLIRFGGKRRAETRRPSAGTGVPEIKFKETPLNMVIEFFRDLSGVNFHVHWRAMEAVGISKDAPVTLNVRRVSIARALDLVLGQLNVGRSREDSLYWIIDQGVVTIATGEVLNRTTRVRIYDIGDLLMVVPNFKGPDIDLQSAGNTTGSNRTSTDGGYGRGGGGLFQSGTDTSGTGNDTDEDNVAEQRQRVRDTLIEIIKLSIGDDMWSPTGKGSIRILRNQLIVSQTPLGFKLMERALRR